MNKDIKLISEAYKQVQQKRNISVWIPIEQFPKALRLWNNAVDYDPDDEVVRIIRPQVEKQLGRLITDMGIEASGDMYGVTFLATQAEADLLDQ